MALHISLMFCFGLLGNIISCFVCLSPLPTFYLIYKKKTSEGFQSIPYVIALLSAMLWLFYAIFQKDSTLLITINSFTFLMEVIYIAVYLFYATKKDRMVTIKFLLLFNVFGFGVISILTLSLTHGKMRVKVLGWINLIFALSVFAAPLCIVRKVIKTKSVEFMPFYLSFFLTLSAVMWFFYGFFKKDPYVAIPNTLGFVFGLLQMVLYVIYRNSPKKLVEDPKLQLSEHVVDVAKLGPAMLSDLNAVVVPEPNCNVKTTMT
uniref:Bidirectional sugar transporter SWEET n=2 Tax=Rhizophora mucronata TaxID=61149 RepID=A0A2P2JL49_RHIMU